MRSPTWAKQPPAAASTPVQQRDVVRTASMAVEVTDVDRAAGSVLAWTARAGGRVDGDDRDSQAGSRHAQLVLRLPPAALDAAIARVSGLGHELKRAVHGQDVTASHADIDARVTALRTSVGRLTDFLRASGKVSDLVTLESQLSQREADLESMLAQQRALADQISLASLTVDLSVKAAGATGSHHRSLPAGFGSGLVDGLRLLLVAVRWSLAALGYLLPFVLIALLVLAPLGLARRRRSAKQVVAAPAVAE